MTKRSTTATENAAAAAAAAKQPATTSSPSSGRKTQQLKDRCQGLKPIAKVKSPTSAKASSKAKKSQQDGAGKTMKVGKGTKRRSGKVQIRSTAESANHPGLKTTLEIPETQSHHHTSAAEDITFGADHKDNQKQLNQQRPGSAGSSLQPQKVQGKMTQYNNKMPRKQATNLGQTRIQGQQSVLQQTTNPLAHQAPQKLVDMSTIEKEVSQVTTAPMAIPTHQQEATSAVESRGFHSTEHKKKELSEIVEARETSSLRATDMTLQDRVYQKLRRVQSFVNKMHQKSSLLQQGSRRSALLAEVDDKDEVAIVTSCLQFFMSNLKSTSLELMLEILSVARSLPNLFQLMKIPDSVSYLCRTLIQNIEKIQQESSRQHQQMEERRLVLQDDDVKGGYGRTLPLPRLQPPVQQQSLQLMMPLAIQGGSSKSPKESYLPQQQPASIPVKSETTTTTTTTCQTDIFDHYLHSLRRPPTSEHHQANYEVVFETKVIIRERPPDNNTHQQNQAEITQNSNSLQHLQQQHHHHHEGGQIGGFDLRQRSMLFDSKRSMLEYLEPFL